MRRLVVMRHATAASGAGLASDHERPLTAHGAAEAESMGRQLAACGWIPDRALVSDAARTTETWWCMEAALGSPPMTELPGFYGAGVGAMVAAVKRLPPTVGTALVLGHNPGWSEAIGWLTGSAVQLAPGQAALLQGQGTVWSDSLGPGALALSRVLHPVVTSG